MAVQDPFSAAREAMVRQQMAHRDIRDPRVLDAFRRIPRHEFVDPAYQHEAYADHPLPIGFHQTISQPYIVAAMTSLLQLTGSERVLEVGTGSGYQAAILAALAHEVHTVERIPELAQTAREILARLGCRNATVHTGDGSAGWPAAAPYHAILVTAAAPDLPAALAEQLDEGGRLVIPVGGPEGQTLERWHKQQGRMRVESIFPVAFVPLRGRYGWSENDF